MLWDRTYEQFLVNLRISNIPTHAYRRRRSRVCIGAHPNLFSLAKSKREQWAKWCLSSDWGGLFLIWTLSAPEITSSQSKTTSEDDHCLVYHWMFRPTQTTATRKLYTQRVWLIWNMQSWCECALTLRGSTQNELGYDRSKIIKLKIHCMAVKDRRRKESFPYFVLYTALKMPNWSYVSENVCLQLYKISMAH